MQPRPFHAAQRAVALQQKPRFLRQLGFIDRMETKGLDNIRSVLDVNFQQWVWECSFPFEDIYDVSNDTHSNCNNSVMKYDVPQPDLSLCDQAALEGAKQDVMELWRPLADSCRILDMGEVQYVPKTNPGAIFKMAGFKTKREAVQHAWPALEKFWNTAHHYSTTPSGIKTTKGYPVLWKQASKVELLKRSKLESGDLRGFTCPPVDFFAAKARMCQHFNEESHKWAYWLPGMQRCGLTIQYGGFHWLMTQLEGLLVGAGDCKKWDGPLCDYLFAICEDVRFHCWDKQGMSVEEWRERMDYYYEQTVRSFILLPSGEVIQKFLGNPSGDVNTTVDNCIIHQFIICYIWRRIFGGSLLREPQKPNINLFADDNIYGTDPSHRRFHEYDERARYYKEFGITLAKEKDVSGREGPEGVTFLGPAAKLTGWGWAPLYPRDKIVCSMLHLKSDCSPEIRLARTLSLMVNATFDRPLFDLLRGYALRLMQRGWTPDWSVFDVDDTYPILRSTGPPSWEQCRDFWFGFE